MKKDKNVIDSFIPILKKDFEKEIDKIVIDMSFKYNKVLIIDSIYGTSRAILAPIYSNSLFNNKDDK